MCLYDWDVHCVTTGDVFSSPRKKFRSLADAEKSLRKYIRKQVVKGKDPEDFMFQITRYNPRTQHSECVVYTDSKGKMAYIDFEERVDVDEEDKERDRLTYLASKLRLIGGDTGVGGLDPSQRLKLANIIRKIEEDGKSKK